MWRAVNQSRGCVKLNGSRGADNLDVAISAVTYTHGNAFPKSRLQYRDKFMVRHLRTIEERIEKQTGSVARFCAGVSDMCSLRCVDNTSISKSVCFVKCGEMRGGFLL